MSIIGSLPAIITAGQAVTAAPVMADFNWIVSQVNSNAQPAGTVPTITQWQPITQTLTFVSATSFSVPGNLTGTFLPSGARGLKLQSVNTGGTIYSYVTDAVLSAGVTTVTVFNLNGVLDSGLSAVSYGIISSFVAQNALPQSSIVQVLWGHNTDVLATGAGKIVCTNNGFSVAGINYGGAGNFSLGTEFSTATGIFTPTRPGYYQISQYVQINTTGVTFSGICAVGAVASGALAGPVNPDFYANLQANRASAVNCYTDYLIAGGAPCNLGLRTTFSAGTPVFVQGVLTIIGPL